MDPIDVPLFRPYEPLIYGPNVEDSEQHQLKMQWIPLKRLNPGLPSPILPNLERIIGKSSIQ